MTVREPVQEARHMGIAFLDRWLGRSGKPGLDSAAGAPAAGPEDAESQFKRGQRLDVGGTAPGRDLAEAAVWYLKAAGQGHCVAQYNLGLMYGEGRGVLRNRATAAMWLSKAANLGHGAAQYHTGIRQHIASKSGPASNASECRIEALKWLQLASERRCPGAAAASEFVALEMTRQEVAEGGRRAKDFTAEGALLAGAAA